MRRQTITVLVSLVIIILFFPYCGKDTPSNSLSPSILWEKEQAVVSTAEGTKNLWSGFDINNNFFVSNKAISKFILWRGETKKKNITLQYILKGRPVQVFINSREAFKLKPRYKLGTFTIGIPLLKGFNFLEFRKTGKSIFKIKILKIGNHDVEEAYHLAAGQSLSRFHGAGAGHIVLKGKGKVHIRLVEFIEGRVERVTQLVDIFPTFAALFGEKRYFDGQSLLDSIAVKKEADTFGFSTTFGLPPSIGIRWRSWFYIIHLFNNGEELFNLKKDPLKNTAGPEENKDLLTFFRAKFLDWYIDFDNIERTSQAVDLKKLPKGEYENLKSLGYID